MVPSPRVGLRLAPYHGAVLPFNYKGILVAAPGADPGLPAYEASFSPQARLYGLLGGIRTCNMGFGGPYDVRFNTRRWYGARDSNPQNLASKASMCCHFISPVFCCRAGESSPLSPYPIAMGLAPLAGASMAQFSVSLYSACLVRNVGFDPTTSCSQGKRATDLRQFLIFGGSPQCRAGSWQGCGLPRSRFASESATHRRARCSNICAGRAPRNSQVCFGPRSQR